MKNSRRRAHPKNTAYAPSYSPALSHRDPVVPQVNRTMHDFQTVVGMLEDIEDILDKTEDSNSLLPALDQLADVLAAFSVQWSNAADFGQDLLGFFIDDVEGIITDTTDDNTIDWEKVSSIMRCFHIITEALISYASHALDRQEYIQHRAIDMLLTIKGRHRPSESIGNDIILTFSQADPVAFYDLQPKAVEFLASQFENIRLDGSLWEEMKLTMKRDMLSDSRLTSAQQDDDNRNCNCSTQYSTATLLSNLTFDILLLVEMAKAWPGEAASIFSRLLSTITIVPENRLVIVLHALNQICASQLYFVAEWLDNNALDDATATHLESSTIGISLDVIHILITNWRVLPTSIKLCAIAWTSGVLCAIQPHRNKFSTTNPTSKPWAILKKAISSNLHQLIMIAGSDENEQIRAAIAIIFEAFIAAFGSFCLGPVFLANIIDRSFDVSPGVSAAWKRVVFRSNPFVFALECFNVQETNITRALKVLVLRSPYTGVFRYPHFSAVMSGLASAVKSVSEETDGSEDINSAVWKDGDMLQRLFHSCQGKELLEKFNAESGTETIAAEQVETFQHSTNLLMYWALWETARYCVLSRLRTPFGGPQQTLDVFEKQLNSLLQPEAKDAAGDTRLNRLGDLLMFLDRLELQLCNAQHGTALGVIPPTPKPSIVFVRANKKMWDEWFSRIRSRVIDAAKVTGKHEMVIRNGYMLLAELFNALSRGAVSDILPWLDEFERLMVNLVEALVATNASDSISGLYVWCRRAIKDMTKQSSSSRSKHARSERSQHYPRYRNASLNDGQAVALSQISLDWINTAVLHAQKRYEQSISEAISLMETYDDNGSTDDDSPDSAYLCQEISSGLSNLNNYYQLQTFLDSIPIEAYADQSMLWSDDSMMQSLKEYCIDDVSQAWNRLEDYYDKNGAELHIPDVFTLDRSGLVGQNFLFASRVFLQSNLPVAALDRLRQDAFLIVQPLAKHQLRNGLEHADGVLIDAMMLNTDIAATPNAVREFMDQMSLIPDELKMNMIRKDLRYWGRLDTMVNLAKRQACKDSTLVLKQSNEFKFLLSKVARRSECHGFASNIPRTWEGALSPAIQFEEAKAAMDKHDYSTALCSTRRILDILRNQIPCQYEQRTMTIFQSRIYLKLAKWSRSTKPPLSVEHVKVFEDILGLEHETEVSSQARIETITTSCLHKAIEIGANHRKAWFLFGTHHYKQGWGILDELGSFRLHHPVAVAANEMVKDILMSAGVDNPEEQSKFIFGVFVKHCASGQPFDETAAYESIRTHVSKISQIAESEEKISDIISCFQTLLQRILETYGLAIQGYFRFLQFASLGFECNQPRSKTTSGEEAADEISQSAVTDEITATLRLLRLLAKHGGQLYDAFHEGLTNINVGPWANIIPQLFARLDHPEKPVQSLIADLLCKIGEQHPQLIVFHCVVGGNSAHNTPCQRRLLGVISEFLIKSHPELVSQVQGLIRELERITVLWEEVWYKKIMSGMQELKNALQELTEQYQGLDTIPGLGAEEKHAVMTDTYQQSMIPLLATFESLQDGNARPESNHERWFISTYRDRIQAALDSLRSPKAWDNLFEGLNMLRDIGVEIGKELSGARVLQLSDLSPNLAKIQSSLIDIPSPKQGTGVTIQSFEQQVVIIPTKTKPKKLTLIGSDGKRYTYLFKGLEDLHLDERVMQLLRITNGMLQRDKESSSRELSARHYAVVPLSDSSGMIQWVESTVSIYTIIAKWQHRESLCARWMNDENPAAPHPAPQRATDVYHEKAAVALKKAGLPSNHPRRQWPKAILLDLYHEMASETPADLLEREIWSSSPTPGEWWRKSVRFARSTAVMSMIGYVIGLGDRHLENILIDFTTGDLVHIDYNVCFEKGKRLRIPEIVPFRLSRNMLTSLGLTGVEGNFRIGCEQTMKVMRKNKEILVTLLEAFVYDPLVDWQIETTTAQGGVGVGGAGVVGFDSAQGSIREGHSGLILDSENESGSVSGTNIRDSRSSFDTNTSTRASSIRRRLSNESLISISSTSIKSTATTDSSSKRWNNHAGDQVDSTSSSGTLSLLNQANQQAHPNLNQQQPQPSQHPQQQQQQQPPLHQRNVIAVNILRRVRHKLEGRDFEAGKKCKVPEQVDRVIQEATNVENLANMFEGWTPWL
ncbi:Serine/threonine-protein kinase smg1 [Haplosporangium sp. Z 767]|nr:Serine/threonine-protein kinase smg1 [Haplosporangium sp. Z 767]